jgi:hypothetical protein
MDIREAISKAGPGGKIRCGGFSIELTVPKFNGAPLLLSNGNAWGHRLDQLTATDWEVIEPETIEVGDVVERPGRSLEYEVVFIHHVEGMACIHNMACHLQLVKIESLTLIRKGNKKHVFEAIEWRKMQVTKPDAFGYTEVRAPMSRILEQGLGDLCDNGKTYRMTLEEEK